VRYALRKDANHNNVGDAYKAVGLRAWDISNSPNGIGDWMVKAKDGSLHLIEVKDGSKKPSARKLTKMEQKFVDEFVEDDGMDVWYHVVLSVDEALDAVGVEVR